MDALSPADLAAVRARLDQSGRPMERALVAYRLDRGSVADVLETLTGFQNDDGGFGHGLEPDLKSPSSSPFQTSVAFQIFRELGTPASHPMVSRGLAYLQDTYDVSTRSWPVTPADVERHPHAPWWVEAAATPSIDNLNPRAELLGVLLEYRDARFGDWVDSVEDAVRDCLARTAELEMHEVLCVLRLAETPRLSTEWMPELAGQLVPAAEACVGTERAAWEGYGLRPIDVAPRPGGLLSSEFGEVAGMYCDYLVATVSEDGVWSPTWSWSEQYPEAWEHARQEWSGIIIARHLQVLSAYDRLPHQ